LEALKKVKDGEDTEVIRTALKDLSDTAQKIGAAMYQAAAGPKDNKAADESSKTENKKESVEGEFESADKKS